MELSKEHKEIIERHPLSITLPDGLPRPYEQEQFEKDWPRHIGDILRILIASEAAKTCSSPPPPPLEPLVKAVVEESDDNVVWTAAIDLINDFETLIKKPAWPPYPAQVPTNIATPLRYSSARISDSEARKVIEKELFFEIRDCVHRDVPGFYDKYFNGRNFNRQQNRMAKRINTHHDGSKWTKFPNEPWGGLVWAWLTQLEKDAMVGAKYKLHTTKTAHEIKKRKGQVDIMFRKSPAKTLDYRNILVVGEHRKTHRPGEFTALIQQLARSVRNVFADQPLRRFVHGFTLCGTTMELWIFDRSGLYSGGPFDIHQSPDKLACALVAYATMDDDLMGLPTWLKSSGRSLYLECPDSMGRAKRVHLGENDLLVRHPAIICRETTCYKTAEGVAKFSWRSARQPNEVNYLAMAKARGVEGLATTVLHRQIATTAELRSGLLFSNQTLHTFNNTANEASRDHRQGVHSSGANRKRGHSEENPTPTPCNPNREAFYDDRILSCLVVSPAGRVLHGFTTVRELLEALRDAIRAHQSLLEKGKILHRDISSNNIIITEPAAPGGFKGMLIDLDMAKSIDCEQSGAPNQIGTILFMAIQVLRGQPHTYRHDLESFFYVLLWMCACQSWEKDELRGQETEPNHCILREWETLNYEELADAKQALVREDTIGRIIAEFPRALRGLEELCKTMRTILFGDKASLILDASLDESKRLYSSIIQAFNAAISQA